MTDAKFFFKPSVKAVKKLFAVGALLLQTSAFASVQVNAKVFLDGAALSAVAMRTSLLAAGYIPLTDPYGLGVTVASIPPNTVDWIKVELASPTPGTGCSASAVAPAFLLSDGTVVGTDGNPLNMNAPAGSYYIRVGHRNHASLISIPTTLATVGSPLVDMTSAANLITPSNANANYGISMAVGGNANGDAQVDYLDDGGAILTRLGGNPGTTLSGYYTEDLNLNGQVRYTGINNDVVYLLSHTLGGISTNVKAILTGFPSSALCAAQSANSVPTLSQPLLALMSLLLAGLSWFLMRSGRLGGVDRRDSY